LIYWDPTGHYAANGSDAYIFLHDENAYKKLGSLEDASKENLEKTRYAKSSGEASYYKKLSDSQQADADKIRLDFEKDYPEFAKYRKNGFTAQVTNPIINTKGTSNVSWKSTLEDVKYMKGYNSFIYNANGRNVNVNIYITDPSKEYVTFSSGREGREQLSNMTIEGKTVVAKTNAGYFSGSVESLGIFAVDGEWLYQKQGFYDYKNYPTLMAETVNGKQQVTATKYGGQVSEKEDIVALAEQKDWVIAGSTMFVYDGKIAETGDNKITSASRNPRTIIGYREDGSFVIVTVDGPKVSGKRTGLTTKESAQMMEKIGVQYALNLDGGPSTQMYLGKELVSDTILENGKLRSIGSALFVVKK
jgi:exopolysaccharide biosynthesis protein